MSSRVVGRGLCPRCGREGSIVLKTVSGRTYMYFKHGDAWCYLGPYTGGDGSYHGFTTKRSGVSKFIVGSSMKSIIPLSASLMLIASCFGLSSGGATYSNVVLALGLVAWLLFALYMALREASPLVKVKYPLLSEILHRSLLLYSLLSVLLPFLTLTSCTFLACPLKTEFQVSLASMESSTVISLLSLLFTSMAIVLMAKPLNDGWHLFSHIAAISLTVSFLYTIPPFLRCPFFSLNISSLLSSFFFIFLLLFSMLIACGLVFVLLVAAFKRIMLLR